MVDKDQLRGIMKGLLREASPDNPGFSGRELGEVWNRVSCVLAYQPFGGEIDPKPFLQEASLRGLSVYLPRLVGPHSMEFRKPSGELHLNSFGIPEPTSDQDLFPGASAVPPGLVLVPGLAFDVQGNRLGRGKGFYDRFLTTLPASWITLGVGWEFQLREEVPTDPWDCPLDGVVLPGRLIWAD